MTEKRFTVNIHWFNYEKTEGDIELKDNGQLILISDSIEDVQYIKRLLNGFDATVKELFDDYQQLKSKEHYMALKLNSLVDENEQLKSQLQSTCEQRDEFYRGARENANRAGELENDNEKLKRVLKMEEKEAEIYNIDAMMYQTLYEQQKQESKRLKQQLEDRIKYTHKLETELKRMGNND